MLLCSGNLSDGTANNTTHMWEYFIPTVESNADMVVMKPHDTAMCPHADANVAQMKRA